MAISRISIAPDDPKLYRLINDLTGGVNTRVQANKIGDNQAVTLDNVDLNIAGQRSKRLGYTPIANDVSNLPCKELVNYARQGYADYLLLNEGTNLLSWKYNDATWTNIKNNLTNTTYGSAVAIKESGLSPDDVIIYQNGTDNPFRIHINSSEVVDIQDLGNTAGTGNDSPPKSLVMCWYGNRLWVLKNDQLFFSDAYDTDYATSFDTTTNWYRIPVSDERALIPTRDLGIVVMGKEAVWSLAPSATPVATDQPQPLTTSYGCVAGKTACVVGDDVYWLAPDGVRALKRTVQDKLQTGASYPLSYAMKDEFDSINWTYIQKACAVYFDNRYLLAVPTGSSTYNNAVFAYYPAINAWVKWDMPVGAWSIFNVNGKQKLYFADANNGQVHEMFRGTTDNSNAITMTEVNREEDFGQKLTRKVGGWVEVEALAAGSGDSISIYASIDGGNYSLLGTVSLTSATAPTLPISLPFTLSDEYVIREKLSIDTLGAFRTLQIKAVNTDTNTDAITILNISLVTFNEELEDE
jgi:hypothetical protein